MKDLAKLNYHSFVVITIAFYWIQIQVLNPFHKRDRTLWALLPAWLYLLQLRYLLICYIINFDSIFEICLALHSYTVK